MPRRALFMFPAAAAALALTGAAACRKGHDPTTIFASGHVEATDVRVAAKLGGRLERLAVKEGDRVERGQELAKIETVDLELTRRQARAEREQAGAELRLRLNGARAEDIAELEAQVRSLDADLTAAERDLERMQGLLDKGSGTTKARDDAQTRRDILRARREAQSQSLQRLKSGFREEEKAAARARLEALEARLAQIEQQLQDATIKSPLGGVVTLKLAEAGEMVPAGSPLLVVTDLQDAWLTVYVAEPDLGRIHLGDEAEVRTDGGETRKGRITFIAAQAEFTPKNVQTRDERVKLVYKVKLGLENQDGLFKPGMPAEARLKVALGAAR
jgi:HlyD family secretion protein